MATHKRQKKRKSYGIDNFPTKMKESIVSFNREGIIYDFETDFNDDGQFHGVCLSMWKQAVDEEPKFGTL